MSHWGYVIEEITHGHHSEDERRARRLRERARREAPRREGRREGRWASWMKGSGAGLRWAPKQAVTTPDVPCARASSLSRLAQ